MNIKKALVTTLETANADTVTVKQGDSVWSLANTYKTSVNAIEKANSLANSNLIYVGQTLNVPTSKTTSTTAANVASQNYSNNASTQASQSTTSQATTSYSNQAATSNNTSASTGVSGSEASAKSWIAGKESSASYLNGDYSAANQEKVANSYVASRYGSWSAAQSFWQANGWY